jgi:hypothetical protein
MRFSDREPWEIIVGFALLGLTMAGASYAYASLYDYSKPTNGFGIEVWLVSMILCPPQLIFAMCIDCEVTGWDGFTMYSIIGALNAALYAGVGCIVAIVVWTRKRT